MEENNEVNNSIYEELGERWYEAKDDPVALLRAENRIILPWVIGQLRSLDLNEARILDVGCGGGLLTNELAKFGFTVSGVDISPESLKVAEAHDETHSVNYKVADAYKLPYPDESFEVVTSMDFLEHVEDPAQVIQEISRVLRPGGVFFFHTFNRSPLTWLVVIKFVEWFVKNTPKNLHILRLFIKPDELKAYCKRAHMEVLELVGIKPIFSTITWKMFSTGTVHDSMKFEITKNTMISYLGMAKKRVE